MSTLVVDTLTNQEPQLCKAWVNFNGTGTVAIRASYNVSSITDNGTGIYTVNFATAMPDTNYSFNGIASDTSKSFGRSIRISTTIGKNTNSIGLNVVSTQDGTTEVDCDETNLSVFR